MCSIRQYLNDKQKKYREQYGIKNKIKKDKKKSQQLKENYKVSQLMRNLIQDLRQNGATLETIKCIIKLSTRDIRRVFNQIDEGRNFNMKRGRKTIIS